MLTGAVFADVASPNQQPAEASQVPCQENPAGKIELSESTFNSWTTSRGVIQFALVIGNDYHEANGKLDVPVLKNPHQDAQLVGTLLADKGYVVVCLWDLGADDLVRAVDTFSAYWEQVAQTRTPQGIIYFAGHGGETTAGQAFILPEDYLEGASSNQPVTVPVDSLWALLPSQEATGQSVPLVILDACRTMEVLKATTSLGSPVQINPSLNAFDFVTRPASSINSDNDVAIIFSTSADKPAGDGPEGQHGPFVAAIDEEFLKRPWDSFIHPGLHDFVRDLQNDLKANHIDQVPVGPKVSNGNIGFLWNIPNNDWSQPSVPWRIGKDDGDLQDKLADACDHSAFDADHLDQLSAAPINQPWATSAARALHKIHDSTLLCRPVVAAAVNVTTIASEPAPAAIGPAEAAIGQAELALSAPTAAPKLSAKTKAAPQGSSPRAGVAGIWRHFSLSKIERTATRFSLQRTVTAHAPPRTRTKVGTSAVDPSITSAIADRSVGTPVGLNSSVSEVEIIPNGQESPSVVGAGEFMSDNFEIDCSSVCSDGRVFVTSPVSGKSGFVAASALEQRPETDFATHFDLYTNGISPKEFFELGKFLRKLDPTQVNTVEIFISETGTQSGDFSYEDASYFLGHLQNVVADTLSLDHSRVIVRTSLVTGVRHDLRCFSLSVQGLCLSVRVLMDGTSNNPAQ
jgi:hypothetical protein